MDPPSEPRGKAPREYARLLRLHQHLLVQLQAIAEQLDAQETQALVREIRRRTGDLDHTLAETASAVQEAIRTLKVSESEIRLALISDAGAIEVDGVPNLPASLARFLAERAQLPGFTWEVRQDEVRGWVILWKELTATGTVRGSGQFYERPYAWLDE